MTQAFIAVCCIGAYFFGKVPLLPMLFLFILMQAFAVVGAAWAASLRRRIDKRSNALPLANRRARA